MKLADLQERFYALVTAPEGVAKALGEDSLADVIAGDERLDAVARLDIYASMYFYRLLDVLRDAYPRVLAELGDAAFHNLVTDYLLACPPAHPNIVEAGARLPQFLAGHPLGKERPTLAALAWLERARIEVFDGPDAPTLTLDAVRGLPPDEIPSLRLALIPCHRLVDGHLVWRQGVDVYDRAVDDEERDLLALAAAGTTLGALCERVAGDVAEAAQRVFNLVGRWIADGLVAG
jgi:hypothetical protein